MSDKHEDRVEATIDIAASPQDVWDIVMDAAGAPDWVTIVCEDVEHDSGALKTGFQMVQKLKLRGATFKVHWTLTKVDAPHLAVWEGRGPARSKAFIEDRLEALEDGTTRFHYANEFKAPLGPLGKAASKALVGGIPKREAEASLRQLKKLVESKTS